jgi:hypothetical protein
VMPLGSSVAAWRGVSDATVTACRGSVMDASKESWCLERVRGCARLLTVPCFLNKLNHY